VWNESVGNGKELGKEKEKGGVRLSREKGTGNEVT